MARTWTLLLMLSFILASPAMATELPDSAQRLIPTDWSQPTEASNPQGDWVLALGGDDLVTLVAQVERVSDVATADGQLRQAQGSALQAASGLLPSVDVSGSWQTGTPSGAFAAIADSGSMDQYSATANLSVPLTYWTSIPDQRAARADVLSAKASLQDARATATLDLATAWLDLAQARETLAIVEQQLQVEQDLLTVTEARFAGGEVTGVDVLQQRQQLATTRSDLPVAEADVGRAERALAARLRLPPEQLTTLPGAMPEPVLLPLPSPRELLSTEPGVQSALRDWESARSQTRSARGSLLPDVSFTASTGVRYTELVDTELTPTWSAGVQATVPLFDGGTTWGRIRQQQGAEFQALIQLEQEVVDVVQQVEDALALWNQAGAVRQSADDAEQLALEALQAAQAGYAAGTSTYNSVLTAQQTVRTTRQSALQAQRDQVDAALQVVSVVRASWTPEERG